MGVVIYTQVAMSYIATSETGKNHAENCLWKSKNWFWKQCLPANIYICYNIFSYSYIYIIYIYINMSCIVYIVVRCATWRLVNGVFCHFSMDFRTKQKQLASQTATCAAGQVVQVEGFRNIQFPRTVGPSASISAFSIFNKFKHTWV